MEEGQNRTKHPSQTEHNTLSEKKMSSKWILLTNTRIWKDLIIYIMCTWFHNNLMSFIIKGECIKISKAIKIKGK